METKGIFQNSRLSPASCMCLAALIIFTCLPQAAGETPALTSAPPAGISAEATKRPSGALDKKLQTPPGSIDRYEAAANAADGDRPHKPVETIVQKARRYHHQQQYRQAIRCYEEALKIQPESVDVRLNLAAAHIALEQYSKAHGLLEELNRLQPNNADVLLNLAIVAICLNRPVDSFSLLDAVEQLKPAARFEVCMHRGIAYRQIDDYDRALYWYQQAYSLNPNHRQLLFNMAIAYDRAQLFSEAADFYRRYLMHAADIEIAEKQAIEKRIRYLTAFVNMTSSNTSKSF